MEPYTTAFERDVIPDANGLKRQEGDDGEYGCSPVKGMGKKGGGLKRKGDGEGMVAKKGGRVKRPSLKKVLAGGWEGDGDGM